MNSEIYTATQGLVARQFQLDSIANNIANVNTTGYRETSPFFRAYNHALKQGPYNPLNSAANNQPVVTGVFMHSKQGGLKETGNPFDLAIQGEGYFKLQTPNGLRYSRNGHFTLSPVNETTGRLETRNGYPVLDSGGNPILLGLAAEDTYVNRGGTVIQDGAEQGSLALVTFADKTGFLPEEDTLLLMQDPVAQEIPAKGRIRGGYLETSNVNIAKQMIDMIIAQRAYESNIRTIRTIDTGMNQAVIQGLRP